MYTYQSAQAATTKNASVKIDNNTRLERRGNGDIAVKLHGTDVVTYHPDGSVTLNSGGWQTVTTKDRINKYAPVSICQKNRVWYVGNDLFFDGMTVSPH